MILHPFTRRGIYLIDFLGTLLLGLALLVFPVPGADVLGPILTATVLFWLGVGLVAWSVFNLAIGLSRQFPPRAAVANVAGDALWVLASLFLLTTTPGSLSAVGAAVVGGLAIGVGAVGIIKAAGIGTARRTA